MNTVNDNLKSIIKSNGLKQKYVAEKIGFTPQNFSNMLNGRKRFEIENVINICNTLGITPNELFGFNDNQSTAK